MKTNEFVNVAINYILENINEPISVEEIARHCNFSKSHLSRLFKLETGEGIYEFIKRVKLEQSAFRLKVEKGRSITDIGYEYGYSSSNYSSAFKQQHNICPALFRRKIDQQSLMHPFYTHANRELETFEQCNNKITIEVLPDYFVLFERYKGNYKDLSINWGEFQDKHSRYITEETLLMERTFDDPTITDQDECLYDICMTIDKNCTLENTYTLKGGKFAIYHFKGLVEEIYFAYQSIWVRWLPESGNTIDTRYGFERYTRVDCANNYMEIDICIPIK